MTATSVEKVNGTPLASPGPRFEYDPVALAEAEAIRTEATAKADALRTEAAAKAEAEKILAAEEAEKQRIANERAAMRLEREKAEHAAKVAEAERRRKEAERLARKAEEKAEAEQQAEASKAGPPAKSHWIDWADLAAADPDVVLLTPCGFELKRVVREAMSAAVWPHLAGLRATRDGRLVAIDGHHLFNRPGPRLVDSLELLAELLHPGVFAFEATQRFSRVIG